MAKVLFESLPVDCLSPARQRTSLSDGFQWAKPRPLLAEGVVVTLIEKCAHCAIGVVCRHFPPAGWQPMDVGKPS